MIVKLRIVDENGDGTLEIPLLHDDWIAPLVIGLNVLKNNGIIDEWELLEVKRE